ncbi:LacI family DNA-binding transcriptional regulator [Sphingobacterium sp. LRF_L2]|uniref:LacI family DNA-binding transcriptional regulator n=1 Tax=Sphingobacterium sp. LRF_L2 TaxID=3369421 RepID=UPI003F639191
MKSHQVTIIDLAAELNISISTVSRALSGHPNVKAETRRAVLELAEKLDYQRNQMSISFMTSKTKTIGIIVPEFTSSFFSQLVTEAQNEASRNGYMVLICQSNENYNIEVANTQLMRNRVDGVMMSITKETKNFDHLHTLHKRGIPIVLFNRVCDEIMAPKVIIDDYDAAFKAVEHLITTGKKRIAHLAGPPSLNVSKKRLNGYIDALKKNNIPIDESLIISYDLNVDTVKTHIKQLLALENPPDGIFAINDPAAIESIQTLKQVGKKIPDEIAVVGFSDDIVSKYIEPGLTTVAQPVAEMAVTSVQLLLELVNTDPADWKRVIKVLNTELIIRESTMSKKS